MTLDVATRYALYLVGGERCVWCGRPITFKEMEADHLIPKSLDKHQLSEVLELHGLPADFDVESVGNRAPSCRQCNGSKRARIPPNQPIIAMMMESARSRAPAVQQLAQARMKRREAEKALARIEILLGESRSDGAREVLDDLAKRVASSLAEASDEDADITVELHPAFTLIWNPSGRWHLRESLGPHLATVTDGRQTGLVGTDITYMCPTCGSYGPWSGALCLTCGRMSGPWD